MIKGYILPLGSIVTLKEGSQKLMIIGRAQLYRTEDTTGYFDYSAVLYPLGVVDMKKSFFFSDEDVNEVVFEGFRDGLEKAFAGLYDENVQKAGYPKFTASGINNKNKENQ